MMKKMINKCRHGRKKIPISKIAKRTSLQVTFSKRRSGLFKKASELCTLCGVEVAIIVFSPANKPFSFGHPEVESITDRFLARNPTFEISLADSSYSCSEAQNNATSADRELNKQLMKISNLVEVERKRGESLDKMRKASNCWWEKAVEELGLDEIQILMDAMEELKKHVNEQGNRVFMETTSTNNVDISSSLFMMNNNTADHYQLFESIPKCDQIVGSCAGPIDIPSGAYEIGFAADGFF